MTKKELRRLSRGDLLEMLIDQSVELESVREQYTAAQSALDQRELKLSKAGSIAEAALQLNGVFQAAEAAAQQYLEELQALLERQRAAEEDSQLKAEQLLEETRRRCEDMEREAKIACAEMTARAKAEAEAILAAAQQNRPE